MGITKPALNINDFRNKIIENIDIGCYVVDAFNPRILFLHRPLVITEREEGKNIAKIMNKVFEKTKLK